MKPDIKNYRLSSYVWKRPEPLPPEEEKKYLQEQNAAINRSARKSGLGPDWVRALGWTPEPDLV